MEVLSPYINSKNLKSLNIESIKWKNIGKSVPNKTIFDCRNKLIQIMQVLFRTKNDLDEVLVDSLENQNTAREVNINWKKWKSK